MGGNSFRTIIRLIAGGYICYLGYQLIKGYLYPTEETGDPVWFMMLFGILFIGIGAFLIVDAIRHAKGGQNDAEDDEETEEQDNIEGSEEKELPDKDADDQADATASEATDNYSQTMTIAERIRRLSEEDESDQEPSADDSDNEDKSTNE